MFQLFFFEKKNKLLAISTNFSVINFQTTERLHYFWPKILMKVNFQHLFNMTIFCPYDPSV